MVKKKFVNQRKVLVKRKQKAGTNLKKEKTADLGPNSSNGISGVNHFSIEKKVDDRFAYVDTPCGCSVFKQDYFKHINTCDQGPCVLKQSQLLNIYEIPHFEVK